MKIAVLNFSGNVGKTTITSHLLNSHIPNASIFSVESINEGIDSVGVNNAEKIKGTDFGSLIDSIMMLDDAIVDIGSSNIESFLKKMSSYHDSHEEFDLYLVPVTKEKKVLQDSINTLNYLNTLGIDNKKVKVIFNKIDVDDNTSSDFSSIFGLLKINNSFIINKHHIEYNEVYEMLKSLNMSLSDINNDGTDYQLIRKTTSDENEKMAAIKMINIKRLAKSANRNLDMVYQSLVE
jgi:dimeric dUTPase (all-alpha-NTP-PPase superfamily)